MRYKKEWKKIVAAGSDRIASEVGSAIPMRIWGSTTKSMATGWTVRRTRDNWIYITVLEGSH